MRGRLDRLAACGVTGFLSSLVNGGNILSLPTERGQVTLRRLPNGADGFAIARAAPRTKVKQNKAGGPT